jgi:hypothetical protein
MAGNAFLIEGTMGQVRIQMGQAHLDLMERFPRAPSLWLMTSSYF